MTLAGGSEAEAGLAVKEAGKPGQLEEKDSENSPNDLQANESKPDTSAANETSASPDDSDNQEQSAEDAANTASEERPESDEKEATEEGESSGKTDGLEFAHQALQKLAASLPASKPLIATPAEDQPSQKAGISGDEQTPSNQAEPASAPLTLDQIYQQIMSQKVFIHAESKLVAENVYWKCHSKPCYFCAESNRS